MSVAKHYTEWSKEEKDALASQRMEKMMKKNEEIRKRYAEVEADRKKAEQQNSSVTLAIKAKSPTADEKFFDDSRTRGSGYEDSRDAPRRNSYNSGSKDFRNSRQGAVPRKPNEKESAGGSDMSERKRDDYEKWKAGRKVIDEERKARHKVKREWDEDKVEQEPEYKPLPSSKFYREPSWSKQDDRPHRRDFTQRGHYRGNYKAHFNRRNYENEDAGWQDKPNKSFGRSGTKDSSYDKFGGASLSDDEDNRYNSRQWKFDSSNNYSGSRKNQDGSEQSFRSQSFRGSGRGFSQGSRNEYGKPNSSLSNQNNSFSRNTSHTDPVRTSRAYNSSDNSFDRKNDGQDNCRSRFQGNNDTHGKSRGTKQSSGTWSDDEDTNPKSATMTAQKSDSSGTKQSSSKWSDDDDDSTYHKTNDHLHSVKWGDSFSKKKQSFGEDEDTSSNVNTALSNSKPKQSSGTWSDDENSVNSKTNAKTSVHSNSSSVPRFRKKPTGDTWSDDDDNCAGAKTNPQPSQKDSSIAPRTKQSSGTWSDDDGTDVKQHSKLSSSSGSKDHVSSSGAWSDIDDGENSTSKSRNDDAWCDRNETSSSKTRRQPPVNFAGGGRKWSFEPSQQYSSRSRDSSYNDHAERKGENRAVTLGAHDLTVTISGASADIKGNRPFSQWGIRNSEPYYKNTERQALNRSLSDPDKHQVKHGEPYQARRYDNEHRFQQNSRNFRGRGSSSKRGNFSNTGFQKSNFEDSLQQKFRDSSLGGTRGSRSGFQHSINRGARRTGATHRNAENHETPNRSNRSHKNEKPDGGWGDIGNDNLAVQPKDVWGGAESSENAHLSPEWIDDNSHNKQCLKSEGKTEDGWETENCSGSSIQPNDDNWKSEDTTHNQIKEDNKMDYKKNSEVIKQRNPDVGRSHENVSSDTRRNVHESPLHETANVEYTGSESHDDSSWVTTSGDEFEEELGGGEYIDDDESLRISSVQHCDYGGDDASSPEPPPPNFVCSLAEYLILKETAKVCNIEDKTEAEQVHGTEKSESIGNTFCSTPKVGNSEMTENILPGENELSNNECDNSSEVLPAPASESNTVTENCPRSVVVLNTMDDDQELLPEDPVKSGDGEVSAADHCKNADCVLLDDGNQTTMPEMEESLEQLAVSDAVQNLVRTDDSCKDFDSQVCNLSPLESALEVNDALEGQNTTISGIHSKNVDLSHCSETPPSYSIANLSDTSSVGDLQQNSVSVNPKLTELIFSKTGLSNTSENLGESSEFQNSTPHNVVRETNSLCITSSDSAVCENHNLTVVSPEEDNCPAECNKQEDRLDSETGKPVISSSELCAGDKTEMGNETAITIQQTDVITSSEMPMPSGEDLEFSKSVPTEVSCVMEKNV